jgi:hypothetical protein
MTSDRDWNDPSRFGHSFVAGKPPFLTVSWREKRPALTGGNRLGGSVLATGVPGAYLDSASRENEAVSRIRRPEAHLQIGV